MHRIADAGVATERTQRLTTSLAHVALITLALGIAAAVFVSVVTALGLHAGSVAAVATAAVTLLAWHVWGKLLRRGRRQATVNKTTPSTSLHDRID